MERYHALRDGVSEDDSLRTDIDVILGRASSALRLARQAPETASADAVLARHAAEAAAAVRQAAPPPAAAPTPGPAAEEPEPAERAAARRRRPTGRRTRRGPRFGGRARPTRPTRPRAGPTTRCAPPHPARAASRARRRSSTSSWRARSA